MTSTKEAEKEQCKVSIAKSLQTRTISKHGKRKPDAEEKFTDLSSLFIIWL